MTSLDPPGAMESEAATVDPAGAIVGGYWTEYPSTNPTLHGYLLYQGKFNMINVPGAGNYGTSCGANNPLGQIVGSCHDTLFSLTMTFTSVDYLLRQPRRQEGSGLGVIVGATTDSVSNKRRIYPDALAVGGAQRTST